MMNRSCLALLLSPFFLISQIAHTGLLDLPPELIVKIFRKAVAQRDHGKTARALHLTCKETDSFMKTVPFHLILGKMFSEEQNSLNSVLTTDDFQMLLQKLTDQSHRGVFFKDSLWQSATNGQRRLFLHTIAQKELRSLYFSKIPLNFLEKNCPFSLMTRLEHLSFYVDFNMALLPLIKKLEDLPKLEYLTLHLAPKKSLLFAFEITPLTQLKKLEIKGFSKSLWNPSPLFTRLTRLETLIAPIRMLETQEFPLSLKHLHLEGWFFEQHRNPFSRLTNLETFKLGPILYPQEQETSSLLSFLSRFQKLKTLELIGHSQCKKQEMDSLHLEGATLATTLKSLTLKNAVLTFSGQRVFPALRKLDFSEVAFKKLRRASFPRLEKLSLLTLTDTAQVYKTFLRTLSTFFRQRTLLDFSLTLKGDQSLISTGFQDFKKKLTQLPPLQTYSLNIILIPTFKVSYLEVSFLNEEAEQASIFLEKLLKNSLVQGILSVK